MTPPQPFALYKEWDATVCAGCGGNCPQSATSQLLEKDKPLRDRYLRYLAATGTVFDTGRYTTREGPT